VQRWPVNKPRELYLFGTHEHLDHRSGLPFSQFCYIKPPFTLHLYGSHRFLNVLDERYGIFSRSLRPTVHLDDPIDFRMMAAKFRGVELRNEQFPDFEPESGLPPWQVRDVNMPVQIGSTLVTAFDVYHGPTRCLAYKVQHGDVSFIFCTDHEIRRGPDASDPRQAQSAQAEARLVEQCRGVTVAYFDGQYFLEEYLGRRGIGNLPPVSRLDWGHGCVEDIVKRAKECKIGRTYVGHHDPERTWPAKLELDRWLMGQSQANGSPRGSVSGSIELAKSEDFVDL
jgi:hypothetical protein